MSVPCVRQHDGYIMTTAAVPVRAPRLYRATDGWHLGGVASGLARHMGLPKLWVRVAFVVMSTWAGLGVLLYGAFWIVVPADPAAPPRSRARTVFDFVAAIGAVISALLINAHTWPLGWWFVPSVLSGFGALVLWRQATETERERWRRLSKSSISAGAPDRDAILRIAFGIALVVGGGVLILVRTPIQAVGAGLVAVAVTVTGIALVTGPWWSKLMRDLADERNERIRSEERADIAAHLHDSVLQTLALIQRNAHSPREVARLARIQERELRTKLYGGGVPNGQFGTALHAAAAEVEDTYAVTVDLVVVGEHALDVRLDAVVAAAREAMINAAKHAGVTSLSVYAELDDDSASVFVRDRGAGFDIESIEEDRQGVRGSIIGRLERHGGRATIKSRPGEGTEVALRMGLS